MTSTFLKQIQFSYMEIKHDKNQIEAHSTMLDLMNLIF